MAERVVNIGLGGFAGPPGLQGPPGPPGEAPFSNPTEDGTSTIDSSVRRVDSYHSAQAVFHTAGTGMGDQFIYALGPRASRIILQFFFADHVNNTVQTIDMAQRILFNGTSHINYDSGDPVIDDTDGMGATVFMQTDVYSTGPIIGPVLDIQVYSTAPFISCHVYEIW